MGFKARVWIVTGALVLAVALYFMPKKAPESKDSAENKAAVAESQPSGFRVEQFIENTKKQFRSSQLMAVNNLEAEAARSDHPAPSLLDSIAVAWDELKQPGIAAYYYELKAQAEPSEKNYINAAYRYFDVFKASEDTVAKAGWVQKAIATYKKVLELNPANLNAKTDLGVCYAEGTGDPMQGIMLLREVVTTNPEHENAQLNLGFLSVKSGQYEKALERFDKVLAINPKRFDVYIYKGETSLQMGNKEKAMAYFQKFMKESPDENMKMQVSAYIKELEKTQ